MSAQHFILGFCHVTEEALTRQTVPMTKFMALTVHSHNKMY